MKKQRKALTAACLLAFAATAWAAPETVVTNAPAAAQPVTVASAAPVAVVTVETVKDVNQFPAADQHPPVQNLSFATIFTKKLSYSAKKL